MQACLRESRVERGHVKFIDERNFSYHDNVACGGSESAASNHVFTSSCSFFNPILDAGLPQVVQGKRVSESCYHVDCLYRIKFIFCYLITPNGPAIKGVCVTRRKHRALVQDL